MSIFKITAVHVRDFLQLNRSEFQRWLDILPPFSTAPTQARQARVFTLKDLVFFGVIALMHRELGVALNKVAQFSAILYQRLGAPIALDNPEQYVALSVSTKGEWDISIDRVEQLSLVVNLGPIWEDVYRFLGLGHMPQQKSLPFGLVTVDTQYDERVRA